MKQKLTEWLEQNNIDEPEFIVYCVFCAAFIVWVINWIVYKKKKKMTNLEHYNKAKQSGWQYQPELKAVAIAQMEIGKTYFDTDVTGRLGIVPKMFIYQRPLAGTGVKKE